MLKLKPYKVYYTLYDKHKESFVLARSKSGASRTVVRYFVDYGLDRAEDIRILNVEYIPHIR